MAQLPETAITAPSSQINTDDENTTFLPIDLSETKQSESNNITKEDEEKSKDKSKDKVIKIKILMIRQSEPFYVYISSSSTIIELKKEIEKVISSDINNNNNIITADKQRLIYKGHALKNKDTIFQCNIKDCHAIHLVPQKSKPKTDDDEKKAASIQSQQQQQQQPIQIDHIPYKNVVCPKCSLHLCLTQPMLCYASYWSSRNETNQQLTVSQIVNGCRAAINRIGGNNNNNDENKNESENIDIIPADFDESKHGAHCDMDGCPTPNIRSTDYCYHCPNKRYHPFGYDLCQNCARYVDNPFINLNIATNHVLRYQLNMFADIFYDRYRVLINRAIGGQISDEEEKKQQNDIQITHQQQQQRGGGGGTGRGQQQQSQQRGGVRTQQTTTNRQRQQQQQQQQQRAREVTVRMNGIDYVKIMDEDKNIILIPKQKIEELERREKGLNINELQEIICKSNSEFRKRVSAVIANPRLIREIFQKECPNLLRENLWIRKFLSEAFEHIECRIYIQARMALNLQDIIQIINDIVQEQVVIRQNNMKANDIKMLLRTFKILKASSPRWIADEKVSKCQSCGSSFGYFQRKHHCKACGDIFCGKHCIEYICKPNQSLMPNRTVQNLRIRLCDECKTKYSYYTYTNIPKQK